MIPTISIQAKLDFSAMKFLAGCAGPCITLVVPDHHPGAQEGTRRSVVQNLVRKAEQMTKDKQLLAPLEELARDPEIESGGRAFAIFRCPEFVARYSLAGRHAEKLAIGKHFQLAPFVAAALAPQEFFILGISKKRLQLFRYSNGDCRKEELPAGVPPNVEEAEGFDQPDHDLKNRSVAGPSIGTMRGVQFGTLSDREGANVYIHDFFKIVDRGLTRALGNLPLLLMGVKEDLSAYRAVAEYPHILAPEVTGNVEHWSLTEIAARAGEASLEHYFRLGEAVFGEFKEMRDRSRTLSDPSAVVRAAAEGRVHRLCVRLDAPEDFVNAAVVETLRTGGDIFALPQDRMPETQPFAAILRY
jgi:hypothetical protein